MFLEIQCHGNARIENLDRFFLFIDLDDLEIAIAVAFVNVDAAKYTWLLLVPARLVTMLRRRWTQRKSD